MDDFRRPPVNRLPKQSAPPAAGSPMPQQLAQPDPVIDESTFKQSPMRQPQDLPDVSGLSLSPKPVKKKKKILLWIVLDALFLMLIAVAIAIFWYTSQLTAVKPGDASRVAFTVAQGSTTDSIAESLQKKGLIKSATTFVIYAKVGGAQGALKAGSYRLSPSESTQEIFEHLTKGTVDTFNITFLPGATIMANKKALLKAGYESSEIDQAFAATYDLPLFDGRPSGSDLEGYFWGDTYNISAGATVKDILKTVFDEYYKVIQKNNLVAGFKQQNLSLYQGLTLASIVQRESGNGKDDPQIAQVFFTRIKMGMMLGSDVTYQYIADKDGLVRSPDLDSPYNTRRYTGLPPTPIATPGIDALRAVANPAPGDYLFFLSGDDDVTYFSKTLEGHERNIVEHCAKKCQII